MIFENSKIEMLREKVGAILSQKRFLHTLGVEKMAVIIGNKCLPDQVNALRVSALLHDISKEYSEAEYYLLFKKHNIELTDDDKLCPALWHSLTADAVVIDDFPEFADQRVLSAVHNHTVGSPYMTLFDEIILLSDYIEEGRSYDACINVRKCFFNDLHFAHSYQEAELAVHRAVISSLDNTIAELDKKGAHIHHITLETRKAIIQKAERLEMDILYDLKNCESSDLAREAVKILLEKKALEVALFDVREKSSVTDFYVNATGRSSTQVGALADDVDELISKKGRNPLRTEGRRGGAWVLVDFGDVIVNVFDKASREFYNLDRHFPEDSKVDISDLKSEVDAKFDINKN